MKYEHVLFLYNVEYEKLLRQYIQKGLIKPYRNIDYVRNIYENQNDPARLFQGMVQRNTATYLIHLGHGDFYFGGMKMDIKNTYTGYGNKTQKEEFAVRLTEPMLYDRLQTLSAEYSLSVELLVNIAVKRLVSDIDFVRNLRTGKVELE